MKLRVILDAPLAFFFFIIVKIKLFWYFRSMDRRKRHVTKFLSKKFTEEACISRKTSDKLISNYLSVGGELLDRKLYKKLLTAPTKK
ncbi:MAG: hypothetical protein K9W46_11755 [Candidatus Heimdallarchaeum endolithica]|uniref:Uncharacterized protein n=1 Tax=Candidatus Heimdallarchaeum endolithica TaxID=2876572 RepID=A0A9Y1BQ95_9ARCH|nr:MAG: hypothetical protein K9W46_11755 [Candidatus Heimdallarchaeum endolithica]